MQDIVYFCIYFLPFMIKLCPVQLQYQIMYLVTPLKKLHSPFYGWGSIAWRLEPPWGGSLLVTTKFPEVPGTPVPNPEYIWGYRLLLKNYYFSTTKTTSQKCWRNIIWTDFFWRPYHTNGIKTCLGLLVYSYYRPCKNERLSWPWSHPAVWNMGPLD